MRMELMSTEKQLKLSSLEKRLEAWPSMGLAFSGGVDSHFLLAAAKRIRPEKLIAFTVDSVLIPETERIQAESLAKALDVHHICLKVDILSHERVVRNAEDRCYHCKYQMFSLIRERAAEFGIRFLLHGVNRDDLNEFRPGLKAAEELGFLSPLADDGWTKKDIRKVSRALELETWNKPSQSCLATRIPHNRRIDARDLIRVERAETFVKSLGFFQVRVRCDGTGAIMQVDPDQLLLLQSGDIAKRIVSALMEMGFDSVKVDPDGYRTGG